MDVKYLLAIFAGLLSGTVYFLMLVALGFVAYFISSTATTGLIDMALIPVMGIASGILVIILSLALSKIKTKTDYVAVGLVAGISTAITCGILDIARTIIDLSFLYGTNVYRIITWVKVIDNIIINLIIIGLISGMIGFSASYIKVKSMHY